MVLGIVGALGGGFLSTALGATGVIGFDPYSMCVAIIGCGALALPCGWRLWQNRFRCELMATVAQLHRGLLNGIQHPTAAAYRNLLRVQGWIGDLCLVVERELFGQEPLNQYHGPTVGAKLEEKLRRLEEHMLLLERCHRMMVRSVSHLKALRGKGAPSASVLVGQAGQVNVDCAIINKPGR